MRKQSTSNFLGFTLVELLIAMAVLEILAAIAAPTYRDYLRKAKWSELIVMADGLSSKSMECLQLYEASCTGNTGNIDPEDIGLSGWPTSKYVSSVEIFYAGNGEGFHVAIQSNSELGGYRYDRGFTKKDAVTSYTITKSWKDSVPEWILHDVPRDYF